jgi:hypothetical protein
MMFFCIPYCDDVKSGSAAIFRRIFPATNSEIRVTNFLHTRVLTVLICYCNRQKWTSAVDRNVLEKSAEHSSRRKADEFKKP